MSRIDDKNDDSFLYEGYEPPEEDMFTQTYPDEEELSLTGYGCNTEDIRSEDLDSFHTLLRTRDQLESEGLVAMLLEFGDTKAEIITSFEDHFRHCTDCLAEYESMFGEYHWQD